MNQARYKIVFSGELMPDAALDTVKENLARLFKSDVSKINDLFSGRNVAIKRNLAESEADQYISALQRAGARVRKEPELSESLSLMATDDHGAPAATTESAGQMTCPKCQHVQPKADECSACGIIIEKYIARQATLTDSAPAQSSEVSAVAPASPYAPPKANVSDNMPEFGQLKAFTTNGRIGRLRYLAWTLVMLLASTPLLGVAAAGYAISDLFGSLLVVLATIAVFVIAIQIGVQRLHDIGWSGWLLLINIVPVVGSVFAVLMVVMPGTNGANRYGPMPPPNSTAVKVLACLFLLVPLSGIIAAIAMPTLFSAYAP
ncbi:MULTISPECIES: DUF805 domain-containing protein [Pseudomonas]|uniref:DUF805 domain-containing protein n=1 Tax=Pseudomonas TaxID=286 RepID=UPI0030010A46